MRNAALKAREIESDVYLPFGRHVTETVISLSTRALITVIRLDGISFETAETADLNDLHAKLNLTLRNVADERLALWTHLVRRQTIRLSERRVPVELRRRARCPISGAASQRSVVSQRALSHAGMASRPRDDRCSGSVLQAARARRRALRRGRQRGLEAT